jgi:predicted transcriptional regulator
MVNYRNKLKKDDLFKLKIRGTIYRYILKNQGLHFRELARRLNIPTTTLRYHLNYLVKQEILVMKKDDKFTRFFVSINIGDREKKLLYIIRVKTTRDVLLYITTVVAASQIEIAKELEKHPTTINFHLKRLMKHGIIEPAPTGDGIIYSAFSNSLIIKRKKSKNEIFYRLKEPKIVKLLKMYYEKSYYHDIIAEAVFSYTEDVSPNDLPPPRIRTAKEAVEQLEKIVYDIFPHPYYA